MAMRASGNRAAYAADIFFKRFVFRNELLKLRRIASGEFVADGNFLIIGNPGDVHRNTCEIALSVREHVHNRVRGRVRGFGAALAPVEAGKRESEYCEKQNEDYGALHRYCRMFSRKRM